MSEFCKQRYVSNDTVEVNGESIPYTSTSENFPIYGPSGELDATMFTFSYERSDIADKTGRPVLFGWNGGPGCGSMFVHMGILSPKKVKCKEGTNIPQTAPVELMNNDNCLLDTCDVVSVDAIGTGYARLYNQEARAKYCSTSVDAEMFAMCIRKWLTAHKRWNSPVYIMGESYGTIRTAMVADALFYSPNIDGAGLSMQVSGIINIGSALNYGQTPFPIPATVLSLPSIAAAHWYHHPEGKGSLKEFFDECMEFCYDEYVPALAKGSSLPLEQQKAVAEKLHRYTGYSVEKLLDDKLNVDVMKYPILGMAEEGASIGLYDARFRLGRFKDVEGFDYFSDDASNALNMPAFAIAFNALWKDQLNINIDDEYIEFWNGAEQIWNFSTKVSPIRLLEKAMHRNPKMKVMFGMGYYDMLTTTGWVHYLVNHYDLPKDRLYLNYYEAGHMPYIGDRQAGELLNDIKAFIKD